MKKMYKVSRTVLAIIGILAAVSLAFQAPAPSASVPNAVNLVGTWDRLNPDQTNPTPEHEVLRCGGNAVIRCRYDKQPEPVLGFTTPPDSTFGFFLGKDVTASWECPSWFPEDFCANTAFVASGVTTYNRSDGSQLVVKQNLAVANVSGQSILYMYWVDNGFACPWFRSFGEALAANPFPLPFDGTNWPVGDCIAP